MTNQAPATTLKAFEVTHRGSLPEDIDIEATHYGGGPYDPKSVTIVTAPDEATLNGWLSGSEGVMSIRPAEGRYEDHTEGYIKVVDGVIAHDFEEDEEEEQY